MYFLTFELKFIYKMEQIRPTAYVIVRITVSNKISPSPTLTMHYRFGFSSLFGVWVLGVAIDVFIYWEMTLSYFTREK